MFSALSVCSRLMSVVLKVWHEGRRIFTQFDGIIYVTDVTRILFMCLFASNNLKQ